MTMGQIYFHSMAVNDNGSICINGTIRVSLTVYKDAN